jgi:hypothetical protein
MKEPSDPSERSEFAGKPHKAGDGRVTDLHFNRVENAQVLVDTAGIHRSYSRSETMRAVFGLPELIPRVKAVETPAKPRALAYLTLRHSWQSLAHTRKRAVL